jgi:hypothetical protein
MVGNSGDSGHLLMVASVIWWFAGTTFSAIARWLIYEQI